jgi:hypothetical protein
VVDGADVALVPSALWARTVKVYDVPLVSPPTVQVSGPEDQTHVFCPGAEVTV